MRYVINSTKPDGSKRLKEPELLRGEPRVAENLIDSISRKYKYTSCVLSFSKQEYTPELAQKALEEFGKAAFPNLEKHQFEMLAVLHRDTDNPHIHIIIPRLELTTGRDLNIAPPGSQKTYWASWSTSTRAKLGLQEVVEDKSLNKTKFTKFEMNLLNKNRLENLPLSASKFKIDQNIRENILNGLLTNRDDVIFYLKTSGFEIARVTDKSISISTKTRNIRLEGLIYAKQPDTRPYAEVARTSASAERQNSTTQRASIADAQRKFGSYFQHKSEANSLRYSPPEREDGEVYPNLLQQDQKTSTNNHLQHPIHKPTNPASGSPQIQISVGGSIDAQISSITSALAHEKDATKAGALKQMLSNLLSQRQQAQIEQQIKINIKNAGLFKKIAPKI